MFKTYTYLSFIIKTIKIMANVNTILFNKFRCISVKNKIVLVGFFKGIYAVWNETFKRKCLRFTI